MDDLLNTIHCCDYAELLEKIPDGSVHALITDPPFGVNYQNNYTSDMHDKMQGDDKTFCYFRLGVESYRALVDNSAIFVYTGWSEYPHHFNELRSAGFAMKEPLICQKRPSGKTDLYGTFQTNADWLLFGHKGRFRFKKTELLKNKRAGTIPNKGRKPVPKYKTRFPSCWFGQEYPWSSENSAFQKKNDIKHPTIKGLEFIKWLIQLCTDPGDTVLDPFCGSGTVPAACKSLGRNFIACEIEEKHCDTARRRIK